MKLPLQKSFRLLKFLNRDQPALIRLPAAGLGYLLGFVATGHHVLAAEVAGRFWTHNDFKLGARRLAWYARRSWINLDVSQDDFFDMTEGLDDAQLSVLARFCAARGPKIPAVTAAADRVFIAARRLDNDQDPSARTAHVAVYNEAAEALLRQAVPDASAVVSKGARKGDFPVANAKQTLRDFMALFPTDQVPWFVISGTFLGLIREKGFLPHDYDIDLGLFEDQADIPAIRQAILDSDRFVLKKYDHHTSSLVPAPADPKNPEMPYILKIIHVSGVHIDLFLHYRDMEGANRVHWHGSSLHRWNNSAFDLVPYPFYDVTVLGPSDPDTYLSENYGDWRTPVTEFNCTTDTPNLDIVRHPIACAIFLKRLALNQNKSPDDAAKLKASLIAGGFLAEAADGNMRVLGDIFLEPPS